jgi:transcriptional regulator with XRE-family HTH domain
MTQGKVDRALPTDLSSLWNRIRYAMIVRAMSQNALNAALSKGDGYISRLLSTQRHPRADSMAEIAEALHVSLDWLISGTGEPPAKANGAKLLTNGDAARLGLPKKPKSAVTGSEDPPHIIERNCVVAFIRGLAAVSQNRDELLQIARMISSGQHMGDLP